MTEAIHKKRHTPFFSEKNKESSYINSHVTCRRNLCAPNEIKVRNEEETFNCKNKGKKKTKGKYLQTIFLSFSILIFYTRVSQKWWYIVLSLWVPIFCGFVIFLQPTKKIKKIIKNSFWKTFIVTNVLVFHIN